MRESVWIVLSQGAHVIVQSNEKFTPLHFASVKRQLAVARVLLEYGADVNAQDKMTRLHYTGRKGKKFLEFFSSAVRMWTPWISTKVGHGCIRHRKADIWELLVSFSSMA
jgi:hypothetical protein